jgi:benzoylformate decarboxylase
MTTVRDTAFAVARDLGLVTWFGNPGSTEIPLLADLPDDIGYLLALHENAAVAIAAGYAIAREQPSLVSLHTTAGLGNAVNALATARLNRAPLVVLVGQQDRRHFEFEPFLTGRLQSLAGDYPVAVHQPLRPQDVPGLIARAWHEAAQGHGPVLIIVPMDDWAAAMDDTELAAPRACASASSVSAADVAPIARLLRTAHAPAVVTAAGADSRPAWDALVELTERLDCPVWQEPFTARAGYPQDHPRFAGFLPAGRAALRETLAVHDVVLVVGGGVLKQYQYEPGPLLAPGTAVAVITADPAEARRSPAQLALVAPVAEACAALAEQLDTRRATMPAGTRAPASTRAPAGTRAAAGNPAPLSPEHVFAELAARLDRDTIVVEESPSSRDALQRMLPAREPLGYLSAAMGGLGFGMPAAIGLRMADPARPVVAVLGDGAATYGIQALWSAAHYDVGVLFVVMANGSYATMDRLTAAQGKVPWPGFAEVRVDVLASGFGCPARSVASAADLAAVLDEVVPGLRTSAEPLLLNVTVTA